MNLEKHTKTLAEQLAEAENSLVPTRARGEHLVDRHIKGRKAKQQTNRSAVIAATAPFVLRLDRMPASPASVARVRERVEEVNRQLRQSELPFRLRMI